MKAVLPFVLLFSSIIVTAQVQNTEALELSFNSAATMYLFPPYVSGVINDPTDPAAQTGVSLIVKENSVSIPASDYTLTASSNKASVVPNANIIITKADGAATVKIIPAGVGYCNITLTLTKASSNKTLVIYYAASAASATPANTTWHSGFGDGSAAIALDENYMVVADDESNELYVHHRKQSGLYVKSYYYGDLLGLTDGSSGAYKEVDVEAAVKSITYPNRYYWIGSMSNSSSFNNKPNRNRLFAVNITGTGPSAAFSYIGKASTLRSQLITWGDNNGYNFTASAADGKDPKQIDGFNIEGMCFAPNNTSLYIAFRAPLVPVAARTKALIAPVLNFETWFNNGSPAGNASLGTPIELNLGGRGFRDMIRLSTGFYIISAGSYDGTSNGAIFKWTGNAADPPVLLNDFSTTSLNVEGIIEVTESGIASKKKLQLLSDDGSVELYNDGTETKDLSQDNFKKYRSDVLTGSEGVLPVTLQYFIAEKKKDHSVLSWGIAQPGKGTAFHIERSLNGKDYSTIQSIAATNATVYSCKDEYHLSAVWYRLKVVQDNHIYYSPVQYVNWNNNASIALYPNPVINGELRIETKHNAKWDVAVLDMAGKIILHASFTGNEYILNTSNWPKGMYTVWVSDGRESVSEKILTR